MNQNKKRMRLHSMPFQRIIPFILGLFLTLWSCDKQTPGESDSSENNPQIQGDEQTDVPAEEDEFSLSHLFTDISEYKYIHPAYSTDAESGAPWGFKHQGIDLITTDSAHVLVPADGEVKQLQLYLNPINNQWQVNLHIRHDDRFSYNLLFEPRAHTEEQIAVQRAAIHVNENDQVTAGEPLGTILNLSSEASGFGDVTVHFDLYVDGQNVCPEPYFKPEVLTSLYTLLHAMYPDGQLCYPPSSTTLVKGLDIRAL